MYNILLGQAVADSLGMPFEKRPADDPSLLAWDGKTFGGSLHHKLAPRQYTDDTQMALMVAESLLENRGLNPEDLSKRYVDWIVSGVARGYGRTTLLAVNRLKDGTHWSESGVVDSYGNGTAMRAAPFGVYYRHDLNTLVDAVKIDSAITHASNEAEAGALAVAIGTYLICNDVPDSELIDTIAHYLPESTVLEKLQSLDSLVKSDITHQEVLKLLGSKADVRETVPAVFYCYLKFDSFQGAVEAAIRCGGDTDTTAAIVGALFGAKLGKAGISEDYYSVENFDKLVDLDTKLYNRSTNLFFPKGM